MTTMESSQVDRRNLWGARAISMRTGAMILAAWVLVLAASLLSRQTGLTALVLAFGLVLATILRQPLGHWLSGTLPDVDAPRHGLDFRMDPAKGLVPMTQHARRLFQGHPSADSYFANILPGGSAEVFRLATRAARETVVTKALDIEGQAFSLRVTATQDGAQKWSLIADLLPAPDLVSEGANNPNAPLKQHENLDILPVALVWLQPDGQIEYVNTAAAKLLGATATAGRQISDLLEGLGKSLPDRLRETLAGRAQGRSEVARRKDGHSDGFLQVTMSAVAGPDGPAVIAVFSDATELKTLEAQFVQSQKMQAVGQLAGGIAHDFNNLLTAINGHCDLLLLRHGQEDSDHSDLIQIRQNANRAAALVRQLLAFSRKQTLKPQVLHLYDTLSELANLLNRLLGEKVDLTIHNSEDIFAVRVDERQLEQVIVNLVVNARDAMPDGGVVALRSHKCTLSEPMERNRAIVPAGDYALIEVEDTGEGIPTDRIEKIFEPFYTTKKVGEGTGLGLSTAYGIIKQMDGFIFVDSTPGRGTLFQLYLPAHTSPMPAEKPDRPAGREPGAFRDTTGNGVILLVEDEAPVRAFAARALQLRGYTVIEADCGEAALEILADPDLHVDLFVSDVVMPGLDGPGWVRKAYETRRAASAVFVSGYSEDMVVDGDAAVPRSSYLAKPFTLNDLVERVRDHMDRYVV